MPANIGGVRGIALLRPTANVYAAAYSHDIVTLIQKPFEPIGVVRGVRAVAVHNVSPNVYAASYNQALVTLFQKPFDILGKVSATRAIAVVAPPPAKVAATRGIAIIEQAEVGLNAWAHQTYATTLSSSAITSATLTFSKEDMLNTANLVASQSDPLPFPWSTTSANGQAQLTLQPQGLPYAQSMTRAITTTQMTARARPTVNPQSSTRVAGVTRQFLVSLVDKHVPVSMNYGHQIAVKTIAGRDPSPMWASPAKTPSQASMVLSSQWLPWYRSITRVGASVQMALIPNQLDLGHGTDLSTHVSQQTLTRLPVWAEPISPTPLGSQVDMVLAGRPAIDEGVQGITDNLASVSMTLTQRPNDGWQGEIDTPQHVPMVISEASYPPPGGLSGASYSASGVNVLQQSEPEGLPFGPQDYAQAAIKWLTGSPYISPEQVLPPKRVAIVPTTHHLTTQVRQDTWPISPSPVGEVAHLTTGRADYDRPDIIYNSGLFVSGARLQVVETVEYPSTALAQSDVVTDQVSQVVVTPATGYVDRFYSESDVHADQVGEVVASLADPYPSKDATLSNAEISTVGLQLVERATDYPPKDIAYSDITVDSVAKYVVRVSSDYASKSAVQSSLEIEGLTSVIARTTHYPDRNTPQSDLGVDLISKVVLRRDHSLDVLPTYFTRNKPNVFATLIYY